MFLSTNATLCFRETWISLKVLAFPSRTLSQTLDLENFAMARQQLVTAGDLVLTAHGKCGLCTIDRQLLITLDDGRLACSTVALYWYLEIGLLHNIHYLRP